MFTRRDHHPLRRAISVALFASATSAGSLLAPGLALAADDIETIIVTGSNIRQADIETAAPMQIVTREDLDRSGKTTLGEYLQTLTADGQGSIPKSFGNGFAPGGVGLSLRGLGASSTLILLNGRRIAPFGAADDGQKIFTDLSVIPLDAVERVEVLKEGASAIYGSDAIAGVVNILLRQEYQGMNAKASLAASEQGDGESGKLSLTGGFGDLATDRYNVYFNLEGAKTESIAVRDRKDRKWIGSGDLRPYGYEGSNSQFLSGFILPGAAVSSPAGNVRNEDTLQFESLPGCEQFTTVSQEGSGGGCIWDTAEFRDLTPEQEYVNFFMHGAFNFSDSWQGYAEAGYSRKESFFSIAPSGVSGAWGFPGGSVNASSGPGAVELGPDHPDNPFPGQAVRIRYAAFDVGPRTGTTTNEFWRALAGLRGSVGKWEVDAAVLHSQTDLLSERTGFLRYSAVRDALGNANSPIGTWRIGDDAHLNSAALYAAIAPKIHSDGSTSIDIIDAKATRSLLDLPGGPLGVAVGVEYRKLETVLTPVTFTDQGDIIGLGFSAFDGIEENSSTHVEFLAPVLPSLDLSAALRYDYYAGGLDATTPKFGVKWSPLSQLTLRGTYAEGFRIPNAAESGDGGFAAFTNTSDPVRCPDGEPLPGAGPQDCAIGVALVVTPNPDLKPEESKSYTFGVVVTPFDSTTLTVDWWQIERENEINAESLDDAIARGNVVRGDNLIDGAPGTGTLLAVNTDYINSASSTVRGIDFAIRQTFDLASIGQLRLDLNWSRTNSFELVEQNGTKREFAGTHGNCNVTNCVGTPKNRINLGATLDMNEWNVGAAVNYRSDIKNVFEVSDTSCAYSLADDSAAPYGCEIEAFYTVDLTGRWKPTAATELFGTVENVLDRVAPLDPLTYGSINYNPLDAAGAVGRYFTVGLRHSF